MQTEGTSIQKERYKLCIGTSVPITLLVLSATIFSVVKAYSYANLAKDAYNTLSNQLVQLETGKIEQNTTAILTSANAISSAASQLLSNNSISVNYITAAISMTTFSVIAITGIALVCQRRLSSPPSGYASDSW